MNKSKPEQVSQLSDPSRLLYADFGQSPLAWSVFQFPSSVCRIHGSFKCYSNQEGVSLFTLNNEENSSLLQRLKYLDPKLTQLHKSTLAVYLLLRLLWEPSLALNFTHHNIFFLYWCICSVCWMIWFRNFNPMGLFREKHKWDQPMRPEPEQKQSEMGISQPGLSKLPPTEHKVYSQSPDEVM